MYKKKIPAQTECGLHLFKELLNGKWKMMLVYYISQGVDRPGQLQQQIPNADRRVLNKQLEDLVLHKFLTKHDFNTKVPKVVYKLTSLGKDLLPLILTIEKWGEEHREILESVLKQDPKFENVF